MSAADKTSTAQGTDQVMKRKLTIELEERMAPGLIEMLTMLPPRTEQTFIRALLYQWFIQHGQDDEVFQRIEAVLGGQGGRTNRVILMPHERIAQERRGKPGRPSRERAQIVLPMVVPTRPSSSALEQHHGAPGASPAPHVEAPVISPPAFVSAPPAPVAAQASTPVSTPPPTPSPIPQPDPQPQATQNPEPTEAELLNALDTFDQMF